MSQAQSSSVSDQDMPALFQSADRASGEAQRGFMRVHPSLASLTLRTLH